jgi:dephospho-CoA kinase
LSTEPGGRCSVGARVPFVGLTGGIGAGKSAALEALARLGCATLSTDAVVHELYADPEVVAAIEERWGPGLAGDRAAVARHAFATDEDRAFLEGLLWPRVGERVTAFREQAGGRAAVVEVPLLFESGMDAAFDATIAVVAPEALRAERAGARGHAELAAREGRQLPQAEKARRATHVVENAGSLGELERALARVLDALGP